MSVWFVIVAFLMVLFVTTVAIAAEAAPYGMGEETARSCPLINIGTPDRPRMVKDPACSSGR